MNIEQIKKDIDNGVMISKITVVKLVEAAHHMEQALSTIVDEPNHACDYASRSLELVEAL